MKSFVKNNIKFIIIIVINIIVSSTTTLATNYLFKAKEVEFDNSNTSIESTNVGDAIDELYTAANNFATYDNRLQGVETKIGTVSSGKTTKGQIDDLNSNMQNKKIRSGSVKFYVNASDWGDWQESSALKAISKSVNISFSGAFNDTSIVVATAGNSDVGCMIVGIEYDKNGITGINFSRPNAVGGYITIKWIVIG